MQKENCLAKFDIMAKSFAADDRIALVHDLDADGISSGAIAYNAIRLLRGKAPDAVITQPYKTTELLPRTISLLKNKKIQKLLVVDSALDQSRESIEKAKRAVQQIMVLDHHKDYGFNDDNRVLVVKPQFVSETEPSKYPTAKFAFDLFSRHVDMREYSWLACVGLIGDNQLAQWKDFAESAAREHCSSIAEFRKIVDIITAVETLAPRKLHRLMMAVALAKGPGEVAASEYSKYLAKLGSQLEKYLAEFKKRRVVFDSQELVWFEFRARANIKSALINIVSNTYFPDKTVIFVQDRGDRFLHFSARRQDFNVKMNELLENAVKGMKKAGAGGHVPAAAGKIMRRDLPVFRKRVMELLQKNNFSN